MKKLLLGFVSALLAVSMLGVLSGCAHEHTFSTDWSSDATNHWHASTCKDGEDCAEQTKDLAEHTFENGKCSVCDYVIPVLSGDSQTIYATAEGREYTFTARLDQTYVLDWSNDNAKIIVGNAEITTGYEFTLASGESITFKMATVDGTDAEYLVSLTVKEVVAPSTNLDLGESSVDATYNGINYTFTSLAGGTYKITWTSTNAYIMAETAPGMSENIDSGFEFTLTERGQIVFAMCTNDGDDTYTVVIEEVIEEVVGNVLTGGAQTVNATYNGTNYTFTAKIDGKYSITWTSTNAFIIAETAPGVSEEISSGFEFALASGESIVICMCTNDGDDTYEVVIDQVIEVPSTNLDLGESSVDATYNGINYTFTSLAGGTYKITWTSTNAYIMAETAPGMSENIDSGFEFTLTERGQIVFAMCTNDGDDTYTVVIEEVIEEVPQNTLSVGDNDVNATYNGINYTFTASESGTYTFTWTSANAYIMAETAPGMSENIDAGFQITLVAEQSITIIMCTNDGDDTYTVNVAKA